MKQVLKKQFILPLAVLVGLVFASSVTAPAFAAFEGAKGQACQGANLSNGEDDCDSDGATSSAETTVQNVVNLLTVIVGIAAVIIIVVNGLRFITANGDSGNITTARNGIIYALVGLLVAGFAQVIVRFVIDRI